MFITQLFFYNTFQYVILFLQTPLVTKFPFQILSQRKKCENIVKIYVLKKIQLTATAVDKIIIMLFSI